MYVRKGHRFLSGLVSGKPGCTLSRLTKDSRPRSFTNSWIDGFKMATPGTYRVGVTRVGLTTRTNG